MLAPKKFIPCYAAALCIKTPSALLAAWIESNILLQLASAPFDKQDETLVPEAGCRQSQVNRRRGVWVRSRAIRYRVTTVLLKASLGSEQYQSMNSRMAWSYERFELEDVRLFKTADFDCSRSGNLRTVFGTRLRLLFAIGSGLHCRGEKHDPVPDLLTSSAFLRMWHPSGGEDENDTRSDSWIGESAYHCW